ncbi:tripartite tricarboxylate transporter substrate binding protein [Piscinibacter sp. XHJ-5]|uniref:Bug family tripartite tricarboxylate transporter substrate binding protein n=1 Tax=Piscinibacter sp. XHJ-5 TaxID=3037797 RepID=UPI0024528469|nr:tripartite tricarboxylate transporter substrate binding protein [Piscinibacter sp. XHJ-5]
MKPHRIRRIAIAAAAAALAGLAAAQGGFPSKPITLIVPAAPGGTTDIAARMLADPLGKALGQTVVVDNRAGASGALAAVAVKRAEADGHTLLMQYSGYHVITPHVTKQAAQWTPDDLRPVANVLSAPQVIVVREGLPVKTLAELVAYAKANPGKLTYASSGNGSLQHVTGAMLEQQAGIQLTHIPYKGTGPALQDLLGAQVDMTFGTPPPFMQFIQQGKVRALAVTGHARLASLPNVPTAAEAGLPRLDASSWFGVFAPAKTPQPVIDRLSEEIRKVMATPSFQQKAAEQGASADFMGPQKFGEYSKAELARWGQVVKASKIEAD